LQFSTVISIYQYKIGPWLLWNVKRKSYALYLLVTLGTKLLENTNGKQYPMYQMVPLSMTLINPWPWFQGHDIYWHWISQKRRDI